MTKYIFAQVLSLIAALLAMLSYMCCSKTKTTFLQLFSNIFYLFNFVLLTAYSASIQVTIACIRTLVFWIYSSVNKKCPVIYLIAFELLSVVCSIILWEGYLGLLPMIGVGVFTFGMWQEKKKVFNICAIVLSSCLIVYDIAIGSYAGIILETMLLSIAIKGVLSKKTFGYNYQV